MDIKGFLNKDIGGLPTWVWGIAGIGGIGLGYYFYSRAKSSQAASQTATTDTTGTATQDAGMGSYQAVGPNAGNTGTPGATINIGVPATPTNWLTSIILANHPVNEYASAGQPGGLPDAVIGTIPANSTVQATGPEVVGAWNQPNGSELWYPVVYQGKAGFVSAFDVVNSSTTIGTQPVPTPTPTGTTLKIRDKTPKDSQTSKRIGVPLYASIGSFGKSVAEIPYGTTVTATGPSQKGPSNKGDTTWWPVTWNSKSGFLSGYDVA